MRNGHAVVLGGGFAGMVTAGVLTEFYEWVTVLDRDSPSAPGDYRRGAPQGRHAHGLMPRGAQLLEEVFPGLLAEMAADGAVRAEMLVGHRFRVGGDELPQVATGLRSVQATLPFHEEHLRRRLLERDGVQFMPGVDVVGLVADDASATGIAGVRIILREPGSTEETIAADLVVDAMGRSGRTPYWLEQLGYDRPPEERLTVDVAYASRVVRLTPEGAECVRHLVGGDAKGVSRGILMHAVEGGRHVVTVTGSGSDNSPPVDETGFTDFLSTVAPPDVFQAVMAAESVEPISAYRFPTAIWRRYDKLDRFPTGLIVTGEALCSLSPLFAQGMTAAALEAAALRSCLTGGRHDLPRRFFREAARVVAAPWRMGIGANTSERHPRTATRLQAALMGRIMAAATRDAVVATQLVRVLILLDPPTALMRPRVLWSALTKGARVTDSVVPPPSSQVTAAGPDVV
ncbi:FAD-dependent oxidoreductase [Streptomyces olivochromogenes]|uniref:FAD-dependent oxidoreductase n=1 Tax=Streptomyces olivochromogenes TaxID=1963 RepID=UPI001F2B0DEB|nr:FAD-dependent monooxygenase [Streptomyces olivochromogenes]MCF3132728.1 FAD-dependent monooxygenase [Streptomyces olivochromogenes]